MAEGTTPANCIFCRIIRGEIPSQKVYEDDEALAFKDVRPAAPVHVLLVPKLHVASLYEVEAVNTGRVGGQEVYHLHIHVIGGPQPLGPMIVRR